MRRIPTGHKSAIHNGKDCAEAVQVIRVYLERHENEILSVLTKQLPGVVIWFDSPVHDELMKSMQPSFKGSIAKQLEVAEADCEFAKSAVVYEGEHGRAVLGVIIAQSAEAVEELQPNTVDKRARALRFSANLATLKREEEEYLKRYDEKYPKLAAKKTSSVAAVPQEEKREVALALTPVAQSPSRVTVRFYEVSGDNAEEVNRVLEKLNH